MFTTRSIVCPIDFSAHSRRALKVAAALARNDDTRLTVVHALDLPVQLYGMPTVKELLAAARQRAEREIGEIKAQIDLSSARVIVDEGRPDVVVLDAVQAASADLLVMGTHGLSGVRRLLLGSVTERMLHLARIPLLAVPMSDAEGERAPAAPPFRYVVAGTDLARGCEATVHAAVDMAARHGGTVEIVHAFASPWYPPELGPGGWLSEDELGRLSERIRQQRLEQMNELFPDREGVTLRRRVLDSQPVDGILEAADEGDADLIVVGAHGRGRSDLNWLGSTCQRVIRSSNRPVLAIRETT